MGDVTGSLEDVDSLLEDIDSLLEDIDGSLEDIDGWLEDVDGRLEDIDGRLEDVDGRLEANHFPDYSGSISLIPSETKSMIRCLYNPPMAFLKFFLLIPNSA